ncbi:MAG: hypothetical protein IT331_10240 [Anaerolineae bacterium]|nr:hypothetical protein [Anaerolineae bacterium]
MAIESKTSGRNEMGEGQRRWVSVLFCFVAAGLAVTFYILVAYWQNGEFGFPLDDAWIHQVYARNLGTRLEFSFFAGKPSSGSTSPLWTILLSPGYAPGMDFRVWTALLGVVLLGASGWMAGRLARHLTDDARVVNWFAPLLVALEWHMVWAAASGMEILLFVFLALALVERSLAVDFDRDVRMRGFVFGGVIAGLLTLTRPEGIVLAGLVGLGLVLAIAQRARASQGIDVGKRFAAVGVYGIVVGIVLAPYLFFNLQTGGTLLPNTFYAKGAEYASLTHGTSFFVRWATMYRQPMIGAQLLLIPGLIYLMRVYLGGREWRRLMPMMWIVALPALYAWRLPVEYQFGRYMMPIIPFVMVFGVVGVAQLLPRISLRAMRRAWALAIGALLVVFLLRGSTFYAQAAGIVNCEMVAVAKWTRANLPPGALLAVHDIGAQGYFDNHPMLDLAGLVSPKVIPFIREEPKLKAWMIENGARYAVFFPTWYANLGKDAELTQIHSTGCAVTRELGEENLGVYQLGR